MGAYIKGLDGMLEDNDILIIRNGDDCNPYIKYIGTLGYSMGLVEVKEPHGDLIDRDQLVLPPEDIGSRFAVEYAPAVIEAEGGD